MKTSRHVVRCCGVVLSFCLAMGVQNAKSQVQTTVLTLEKAIALAKEQNRDILGAEQNRYKAEARVAEARSGAFPQLSASGTYYRYVNKPVMFLPANSIFNTSDQVMSVVFGSNNSYAGGLLLAQPLYNRTVGVALDVADTYRDYIEQDYQATTRDVTLQVRKAFYQVLLARALVKANKEGLDVVRANYENVQSQYNHGTAAEYDLLRAEVELANTEPELITAENSLVLAENALKNLLGLPLGQPITVEGEFAFVPVGEDSLAEGRSNALRQNPMITALGTQESMLKLNVSVEQASYFPSLSLIGSYQWQSQDNTFKFKNYLWANTFMVGLQLDWTLFDGFRRNSRVEQAKLDVQQMHYMRMKAEEGITIQVQSAELRMAEAAKRIRGQEKNIQQAEKAVRIAQTRFKSGVGTQLELLDSQVAMTRAQTTYAKAVYDHLVAKAEWFWAVGTGE